MGKLRAVIPLGMIRQSDEAGCRIFYKNTQEELHELTLMSLQIGLVALIPDGTLHGIGAGLGIHLRQPLMGQHHIQKCLVGGRYLAPHLESIGNHLKRHGQSLCSVRSPYAQ